MPAEQTVLLVPALQEGAVYCVRAHTILDNRLRSSSTDPQCVSITGGLQLQGVMAHTHTHTSYLELNYSLSVCMSAGLAAPCGVAWQVNMWCVGFLQTKSFVSVLVRSPCSHTKGREPYCQDHSLFFHLV